MMYYMNIKKSYSNVFNNVTYSIFLSFSIKLKYKKYFDNLLLHIITLSIKSFLIFIISLSNLLFHGKPYKIS
ncbi:ORF MSV153 hypothetical protein [Melanoplus sanguinipes entomopoxvirus]|uniref:Uncharacterized protein n=1 Tax=Melanoplus sanguinipes entomopoxvirus TaxID=83191 RepID=Q9YVT9_MSEPV|nr:ORF MSV153 hypothetical protein [Melanoplus sanguinipes entomopoxvirus]AAC97676.1 ORF MSV153 hypothetical protein [Melanoplus sanguinipes entomopoxvirus 'O']